MKKIFLDIIPVVIGILLALLINQWRQNETEKKGLIKKKERKKKKKKKKEK